jgi:hypothetical protein
VKAKLMGATEMVRKYNVASFHGRYLGFDLLVVHTYRVVFYGKKPIFPIQIYQVLPQFNGLFQSPTPL